MTAVLRFVYDQPDPVQDPEQAWVQRCLLDALGQASPRGCEVAAILPAGVEAPERARSERTSLARRELVTAWQLGAGRPGAGGMIHASSLVAPLVRHDRAHANEQTVVTLWDLQAWEEKGELSRSALSAQRALLRRARKHADAVVVPTHAMAERLAEQWGSAERIRVIAGAAPADLIPDPGLATGSFGDPEESPAADSGPHLPSRYLVLAGSTAPSDGLAAGLAAVAAAGLPIVVLDGGDEVHSLVDDAVEVQALGRLTAPQRAAVLSGAELFLGTLTRTAWPWRAIEALALGVPVVALDTPTYREVLADGGEVVPAEELGERVASLLADDSGHHRVRARDRGRAFSWLSSAEQLWQLHADL